MDDDKSLLSLTDGTIKVSELLSSMFDAIHANDYDSCCKLVSEHPELVRQHFGYQTSWLQIAARNSGLPIVRLLTEAGIDVNASHVPNASPLNTAVINGKVDVARWLLDHGARITPTIDVQGGTLIGAIISGSTEMVQLILERMDIATINDTYETPPRTALSVANAWGRTEIAQLLREYGAKLPPIHDVALPPDWRERILDHVRATIGELYSQNIGTVVPCDYDILIHVTTSSLFGKGMTLATVGMSNYGMMMPEGMESYRYAELLMHLPSQWTLERLTSDDSRWNWPLAWLQRLAAYPHEHHTFFGPGYALFVNENPPASIHKDLRFDAFLLLGDDKEYAQYSGASDRVIHFYSVVPIYPEERRLFESEGIVSLLEKMKHLPNPLVVSPNRQSIKN